MGSVHRRSAGATPNRIGQLTRETALTSALDASVQAQILNRFCDPRANLGLTVLSIAHTLGVVRHVCDRVAVMYLAEIVEIGPVDAVFEDSTHPYTRALLSSVPRTKTARREEPLATLTGDVPSPRDPPRGCRFHRRCPDTRAASRRDTPHACDVGTDHRARCLRTDATHLYRSRTTTNSARSRRYASASVSGGSACSRAASASSDCSRARSSTSAGVSEVTCTTLGRSISAS